jgi:hypothetical protein
MAIKPGDTSYCADLAIDDKGLYVPSTVQPGTPVLVGNNATTAPGRDVKTVRAGEKLRICVEFRNIGGLNASQVPVKVYYITEHPDKSNTIYQRVYPQVPAKGRIRFCFFWKVPELERKPSERTRRYIRVVLDPDNSLPECSEGNNMTEQEIMIVSSAGGHDGVLITESDVFSPQEICGGGNAGTIHLAVEVRDQDLENSSRVPVTITTDIGDVEVFYLDRVSPGVFKKDPFPACRVRAGSSPTKGDGVLNVSSGGGSMTVKYVDLVDSQGKTVVRTSRINYHF